MRLTLYERTVRSIDKVQRRAGPAEDRCHSLRGKLGMETKFGMTRQQFREYFASLSEDQRRQLEHLVSIFTSEKPQSSSESPRTERQ